MSNSQRLQNCHVAKTDIEFRLSYLQKLILRQVLSRETFVQPAHVTLSSIAYLSFIIPSPTSIRYAVSLARKGIMGSC